MIRADASAEIGAGHVMRCLALAQAWQDAGGRVTFALASGVSQVGKRLQSERMELAEIGAVPGSADDSALTNEVCRKLSASWLVLDGFHFSRDYRESVRRGPEHLLLLDDLGESAPYECDVVLNTNPYASEQMYPHGQERVRFLLGPKYALLRREFLARPRQRSEVADTARRVLITFGGSDPHNVTLQVMRSLQQVGGTGVEVTVVAGSGNQHRAALERAVKELPNASLLFDADNMPQLMATADLAISAGGGTCYELAFQRVPMFLITMAQNHERTVKAWGNSGAAIDAGWFDQLESGPLAAELREVLGNKSLRQELARTAARLVDGVGATRVVRTMLGQKKGLDR